VADRDITLHVGEISTPVLDLLENALANRVFDYSYRFGGTELLTVPNLRLSADSVRPVRIETRHCDIGCVEVLYFAIDGDSDDIQIPESKWSGLDIKIKGNTITIENEDGDWNQFVVHKCIK